MRNRNNLILGLLTCVGLTAVILDVRHNSFWAEHAFLTGATTGFLTLGISIFGINEFIERRASRRWRFVADVAYRGLARESRDVSVTLASLYCDLDYEPESAYKVVDFHKDRLTPLGEIRRFPDGKEQINAFHNQSLPALDSDVDFRIPEHRIRFLLNDADWLNMAGREVSQLVNVNRETVAKWATLLMNSQESREELNNFSHLNDGIFALAFELQRFSVDGDQRRIETVIDLFALNDLRSRLITNHLWFLAGENYRFVLHESHQQLTFKQVIDSDNRSGINY